MSLSLKGARIIDPVLSTHAQGYRNPEFVGMALFPEVPVSKRGGQIIEFGREAFVRYNARRAPGATTKRIPIGYFGRPYQLNNESLDAVVPREIGEDAAPPAAGDMMTGGPGVDLGMRSVDVVRRALALGLEIDQATIARDAALYPGANTITLSGTSQWNDFVNSDPVAVIEAGMEAVRAAVGMYPNVALFPGPVWRTMRRHPKVLALYPRDGRVSAEQLTAAFDLQRMVVAGAITASTAEPFDAAAPAGIFSTVWGKDVILAYAPEKPTGMEEPSFGYTYTMKGHPFVEQERWDGDTRSWVYGVTYERVPVLSGISSGYLIKNAIA